MKPLSRYGFALALLLSPLLPLHAQSYSQELNLGIAAYKNSHIEEAIGHFRKAAQLDSSQPMAHMYLATAYANQYIPGVNSEANERMGEAAIVHYLLVLESDAPADSKLNAAKGSGYIALNMKNWDQARYYYQRASGFDSNDAEPYYSVGVIDWTATYTTRMVARDRLKLPPEAQLDANQPAQKKACHKLAAKNMSSIAEGIDSLAKAIELRPDYDDAMAYLNLMYREKADLECDDPAARAEDLKTADHWVDKTLATKKKKAESPASAPQ